MNRTAAGRRTVPAIEGIRNQRRPGFFSGWGLRIAWSTAVAVIHLGTGYFTGGVYATEPARGTTIEIRFVEELKGRGYFDTAAEYLDRLLLEKERAPEERAGLLFERGNVLRDLARTQLLPGDYEPTQQKAREAYEKFAGEFPDHGKYPTAVAEISQIRQQEMRGLLLKIRKAVQGEVRQKLVAEFKELSEKVRKELAERSAVLRSRLEKFPKFIDRQESPELYDSRLGTESSLVTLRLAGAIQTFDEGELASANERKELTQRAFEEFDRLQQEYRTNLAGVYARLYQGRCYQRTGKLREASGIYKELMLLRSEDHQVRQITDEAHLNRLQVMSEEGDDEKSGSEKLGDLIQDGDNWLKGAPSLARTRIGQGIRWEIAKAYEKLGELHSGSGEIRDGNLERALALAQPLSLQSGEYQQSAAAMTARLSQLLGRDTAAAKDFTAAFFECMNRVKEMELLQEGIEQTEEAGERKQLASDLELLRPSAIIQLQQALTLVRPDTPEVDIARIRYWLCYMYYLTGRHYEASVIGEYVGRKFATDPQLLSLSQEAAFLAMTAYAEAYRESPAHTRQFEVDRMTRLCEFIEKQWPGEAKTESAILLLGQVLSDRNRPDLAATWMEKIGEGSRLRVAAQMALATAYWNAYLREMSTLSRGNGTKPRSLNETIAKYPGLAHAKLTESIRNSEREQLPGRKQNDQLLLARLMLSQIENQQGRYQAAHDALLGGADSLLPQLKNHAPAKRPLVGPHSLPFEIEAHRQWLRSSIGLQNLEDALLALQALGKLEGGGGKAIDLYVAVGEQFATELDQWRDRDERKFRLLLSSFESFLLELSKRDEAKQPKIQLWIGDSWLELAGQESEVPVNSAYLERAILAFESTVQLIADARDDAARDLLTATKFRLAIALRRGGKYAQSMSVLKELLKLRPNAMDLQIEGARINKNWARSGPPDAFEQFQAALQGEAESVEGRLWGWGEISGRFRSEIDRNPGDEKLLEKYLESRWEIADCRYLWATGGKSSLKEKRELLVRAAADVQFTASSYEIPDKWRERFNQLWGKIHSELGIPSPRLPGRREDAPVQVADSASPPSSKGEIAAEVSLKGPPVGSTSSKSLKNVALLIFSIGAGLAVIAAILLNRPRRQSRRRYLPTSITRE